MSETTNTKTPAEIVRQQIESHVADAGSALDPYFLKATEHVGRMKARPGGLLGSLNLPEGMAEALGITPESVEATSEESTAMTAVCELMMDVMHFCKARGLHFPEVTRIAYGRFQDELSYANDVLLYDKDVPADFFRTPAENPNHEPDEASDL